MSSRIMRTGRTGSVGKSVAALTGVAALALVMGQAKAQEVFKIGAPLALTGGLADEGKKQQLVYKMWADKVNAAGGIEVGGKKIPVQIIEYDYQSEGPRAGQLAERLINSDRVNVIMSPFGSGHTVITGNVGERYQVPTIACVASSESVFANKSRYLFGTLSPNANMTIVMADYLKKKYPNLKRVAILGRDDVFPKSMAEATATAAQKAGLEVVYKALYPVGTMDHSAALSAIAAAKPDWIYVTGYTQDLVLARRQMADLKVNAPIITMVTGPAYEEFTAALGPLANGITSSSWWHHSTSYEGNGAWKTTADFYKDFKKASGGADPDYIHGSCAGALVMLEDVVKRAGSLKGDALRDALAKTNIMTFYGQINFGESGMNQARELPIIQVQNGKIVVLFPDSIKNADLQLLPK
jgi:branched-chain amino acid transport system substrate-binding protein